MQDSLDTKAGLILTDIYYDNVGHRVIGQQQPPGTEIMPPKSLADDSAVVRLITYTILFL